MPVQKAHVFPEDTKASFPQTILFENIYIYEGIVFEGRTVWKKVKDSSKPSATSYFTATCERRFC